jgi:hypothetical protein
MLVGKLVLARLKAQMTYGSVRSLEETEFLVASCFMPLAINQAQMITLLRLKPWSLVAFENPQNWSSEKIKKLLDSHGLGSLGRVLIKKPEDS